MKKVLKQTFHGSRSMWIWYKNRDVIEFSLVKEYLWAKFKADCRWALANLIVLPIFIPVFICYLISGIVSSICNWILNIDMMPKWIYDDFSLRIAQKSKFSEIRQILKDNDRMKKR